MSSYTTKAQCEMNPRGIESFYKGSTTNGFWATAWRMNHLGVLASIPTRYDYRHHFTQFYRDGRVVSVHAEPVILDGVNWIIDQSVPYKMYSGLFQALNNMSFMGVRGATYITFALIGAENRMPPIPRSIFDNENYFKPLMTDHLVMPECYVELGERGVPEARVKEILKPALDGYYQALGRMEYEERTGEW